MRAWWVLAAIGCGGDGASRPGPVTGSAGAPARGCPDAAAVAARLPGVTDADLSPTPYLAAGDRELLSAATLASMGAPAGTPPLTRRAWIEAALARRGEADPTSATLGALGLPTTGAYTLDLATVTSPDERLGLVEAAITAGAVVLEAGTQRLIVLGRGEAGALRVLHAPGEVAIACSGGGDLRVPLAGAVVSGLDLGEGSGEGSVLSRLTRAVIYAPRAGFALAGLATPRAAASAVTPSVCSESPAADVFVTPWRPSREQPLGIVVTLEEDPGPAELVLVDPTGARHTPPTRRLEGPPWSFHAQVASPMPGTWTAFLGDGAQTFACTTAEVHERARPRRGRSTGPAWAGRRRHSQATANLFSAFVQRLFDDPLGAEVSWPNLHTVLRDPVRNLLFDHLSHGEEEQLTLAPDCADFPYLLQAYFAWKLDLPFSARSCSRGRNGRAPRCDRELLEDNATIDPELLARTNLVPRLDLEETGEVESFQEVARRLFRTVSSSTGRTRPDDEHTDWYPVPLTREALRPGTMFADPFGHLIVLAGWFPQAPGGYGVLMGVDAQPDATIGRRRFWRGNYLFTADTARGGAGWKAWRPRGRDDGVVRTWSNDRVEAGGWWAPMSGEQYDGSTDDFYDRMEALINPRPLDALAMQGALVDALAEQATRRVASVDLGEQYMATATEPMEMPEGAEIFLTTGPWEDFATPSRDHRLLVAIDTVLGLAAAVERQPARYRVAPDDVAGALARLGAERDRLLAARTLAYTRSDGSTQTITLADLIARAPALEVAYNPNDCPEHRWGAPPGSAEASTCRRRAPAAQQALLESNRAWFRDRVRPLE